MSNPMVRAKCKMLVAEYGEILAELVKEIESEINNTAITGDDAFGYAKQAIRREAQKEGMNLLLRKIQINATER